MENGQNPLSDALALYLPPTFRAAMTTRILFLAGFVLCAALIGAAVYFQYVAGLAPCPLCIFQRVAFIGVGVVLLAGFLHGPRGWGRRVYAGLAGVVALTGAGIAARHVWLQNLPAGQTPECGPGLEFMLDAFPLTEALALILRGSGECAEVQWELLGLTMPGWSLLMLTVLAAAAFTVMLRRA